MVEHEIKERLIFLRTFLKNPKEVGSITPSSRFLQESMLRHVDFRKARHIVEYGAGTGILTREILKHARPDARILCFETNRKFCRYLKNHFNDMRLTIINDSAENISQHLHRHNMLSIDYALSSLPFSNLAESEKARIMQGTRAALARSGSFILYKYTVNFRQYLKYYFRRISRIFVPLNLPPTFVYICQK
ncbi:methyltransferase domain-containing protein [Candidatus Woesearchaeota archaeon]|nr:methyltransferase domain-containing protein [Candidatus Woesearchaeota archaeon]